MFLFVLDNIFSCSSYSQSTRQRIFIFGLVHDLFWQYLLYKLLVPLNALVPNFPFILRHVSLHSSPTITLVVDSPLVPSTILKLSLIVNVRPFSNCCILSPLLTSQCFYHLVIVYLPILLFLPGARCPSFFFVPSNGILNQTSILSSYLTLVLSQCWFLATQYNIMLIRVRLIETVSLP